MSMNNYVGDELSKKVKILSSALSDANKIIQILQEENKTLKDILDSLIYADKEDNMSAQDPICA